jgi:predicted dehydrogenase
VPSSPAPLSDGKVGWGILATGGVARLFTRDLRLHGHRIIAVASRSRLRAEGFARVFDLPRFHGCYADLLDDPEVDVVYVATPHHLHADNAMAALSHGKHVLVEKAFTRNETEARNVVDLAAARHLLVMEAMWPRFLPHMAFVRSVLDNGTIGAVRSLHADHTQRLPSDPHHRLNDPALAGGALLDLGVYPISFAQSVLGPPQEVTAEGNLRNTGVDHSVATIMRHRDNALSTSYSSMETRGTNTATVLGTEGRIDIGSIWYTPADVMVYDADGRLTDTFQSHVSGRGMQYQAAEMERLIGLGETASPLMRPEDSISIMRTMDRIRQAIGVRYPGE